MRLVVLFFRAWFIAFVLAKSCLRYLGLRLKSPGTERARVVGEVLASALEELGATFVKFGQILATRPDILPQGVIDGLARLHDHVPPAPFAEIETTLLRELRAKRAWLDVDPDPIAAASVAQVHRGRLKSGELVAIKVQRPNARTQIEGDLALLMVAAKLIDRLPGMKYVAVPGAVERFADALRKQTDFRLEAENNRRLAKNFEGDPHVRLPRIFDELSTRRVLVMEFIEGVKPTDVQTNRKELAQAGFRAIAKMVFLDGFVHADMHPGNLMFTKEGHVVLIDTGLCAEIPEDMRKPWVDTFLAIALADGKRAAELFWTYAPFVHGDDFHGFSEEICAHLDRLKGRPMHEIEVTEAVGGAMAILRKHRVGVDPVFTVVNLALLVAEGIGKQLDPEFDVYGGAMPYLMEAALKYPEGRRPVRELGQK